MKISSLQKGLVAHWTMSQDSLKGSLLGDKTPYENDGTIYGATFTTDRMGQPNKAMSFDGVSDYIDCGNDSSLNFGNNDFSISFWIKATPQITNDRGIIAKRTGNWSAITPGFEIKGVINNSIIDVVLADNVNNLRGIGVINNALNNQWNYIAYSFNRSSNLLGYLNGENVSSDDISSVSQSISNTKLWDIGRTQNSSTYAFNGFIDDVRIYNRVLSETEIKTLYNSYNPKIVMKTSLPKIKLYGGD